MTLRGLYVQRRARAQVDGQNSTEVRPLSAWRDVGAYVLLAEPGGGKTRAFKAEAEASGGEYITARDFVALGPRSRAAGGPLFIDGLDEVRAGAPSRRQPLDEIRRQLDQLGRPRFRISCREADWLGAVDQDALRALAPDGELAELHLTPLDDEEVVALISEILGGDTASAVEFLTQANERGVRPLLGSPLLVNLMVDAVRSGDQWPSSRAEVYRLACERLATEYNEEHRAERRSVRSIGILLDDAGLLSALMLLSGLGGFSTGGVEHISAALGVEDPLAALSSKVFAAEGGVRVPIHRTVAEYLAARTIARRMEMGLPLGRVLALMSGLDGGIVEPLRGLHAWIAVHCRSCRDELIDRDPLGVVLYGDLTCFSTQEKGRLLRALKREADRFVWFRRGNWDANPFGVLATADMVHTFTGLLTAPDRDLAHQALLDCVIDAIEHSREPHALVSLQIPLEAVTRDSSFASGLRSSALTARLLLNPTDARAARRLLDEINSGVVADPDDELAGLLLYRLYPSHLGADQILDYLHRPKREGFSGTYRHFWMDALIKSTPTSALPTLIDRWNAATSEPEGQRWDIDRNHVSGRLLAAAAQACGETVPIERLYDWLSIGQDKHGFAALKDDDAAPFRDWLSARPDLQKALVEHGWTRLRKDSSTGRRFFWESETRLFRATRPADWYAWLLEKAAATTDGELARYCFESAAWAAIQQPPGFEIKMEQVEDWVGKNRSKWPEADRWLSDAWSLRLDDWQRDAFRRNSEYQAKQSELRRERRAHVEPYLAALQAGTAPPHLMMHVAYAHEERYTDIDGDTPLTRVQNLLGGSAEEAASVIEAFPAVLSRQDLPSVAEILKIDATQRHHLLRPACLLGARLASERNPDAWRSWREGLATRLVAFWLTEGIGEPPSWYRALCLEHPDWVAPVLVPFALRRIRKQPQDNIAGLWTLAQDDASKELARLVLPELLHGFPARASEAQLRILNVELLHGASRHLEPQVIASELKRRLVMKSLDAGQRVAWLVAGLAVYPERYSRKVVEFVGDRQTHAAQLALAVEHQAGRRRGASSVPPTVLSRLIELIAPHAVPEHREGAFWVGDDDRRRDLLLGFINQLAAQESLGAAAELDRLRNLPALARWRLALDGAAFDQQRLSRAASFRHATIDQVADTLANLTPANPLDLLALVLDLLHDLQRRLRGADTNGLRLFRRDNRRTPKIENDCRDVLAELLRERALRVGVHFETEGRSANEKRTDLRASLVKPDKRIALPIEIKKEDHPDLWSGWRTQLKTLYATDPDADRVGIYLVLWFGEGLRGGPNGQRPKTPSNLRDAMTALIEPEDRSRLRVHVLDLSLPPGKSPSLSTP